MNERRKKLWARLLEERDNRQLEAQYELAKRLTIEYPDYGAAWVMLGECLAGMYRFDESRSALDRARRILAPRKRLKIVYLKLGLLYERKGNYRAAERWFRKALSEDPKDAKTSLELGSVLLRQGKFGEAKRRFRRTIRLVPNPGKGDDAYPVDFAYMQLGILLRAQRNYKEAIDCFDHALRLDPKYKEARHARRDAVKALRIKNRRMVNRPTPMSRASMLTKLKNPSWGKKLDNQYSRICSEWDTKNISTTFELAKEMTDRYPYNPKALIALGNTLTNMARYGEARAAIEKTIWLTPKKLAWMPQTAMGFHYGKKGNHRASERWFRKARQNAPVGEGWNGEGFALTDQGRLGDAKRHFRKVIRTLPNPKKGENPWPLDEAYYWLGAILCNEGKYKEAIKCCDASLRLDPTYDGPIEIRERAIRALEVKKELASEMKT